MNNEIEQLTEEVLSLKTQFDDHGRKSVPFVVECGRKLTTIKGQLPHGKWEDWCYLHSDRISMSTVKRWIRVYNRSLVTDLSKMTLDEVYESMKKKKDKKTSKPKTDQGSPNPTQDKPQPPQPNDQPKTDPPPRKPDEPSTETTPNKPQSKFEVFRELLWKLSDIRRNRFDETETKELVRLLEPIVKWYHQNMSIDRLPVVEMELDSTDELSEAA
jgi:hypothetical protein